MRVYRTPGSTSFEVTAMRGFREQYRRAPRIVAIAVVVVSLAGCAAAAPSASSLPSSVAETGATAAVSCAAAEVPSPLDAAYLNTPLALGSAGVAVEILLAEETGDANLGNAPTVHAFRLTGPAPVMGDDAIAFETTPVDGCSARILIDAALTRSQKGAPLVVEVDLGPSTRAIVPADESGFCTWLVTDDPRAAGIECVGMEVTGALSLPRARAWMRVAWAEPSTAALPAWAIAALQPTSSGGPAGPLSIELLEGDVFAPIDPPLPMDEPWIEAVSIARGPTGWVMGGTYAPSSAGDELSDGDAPVWFSPDGRTWERVDAPEIFGGPGYQQVRQVAADGSGWWIVGSDTQGTSEESTSSARLWHSPDGRTWRTITPTCVAVTPTCPSGSFDIVGIEEGAAGAIPTGEGGPLAIGLVGSEPATFDLTADGHVASIITLPAPPDVSEGARVFAQRVVRGDNMLLALGVAFTESGGFEARQVAWTSVDGGAWTLLDGPAGEAYRELDPLTVTWTPAGWYASSSRVIARSADLQAWEIVLEVAGGDSGRPGQVTAANGGLVVVVGFDGNLTARSTTDGTSWSTSTVPAGRRGADVYAVASDGELIILVGRNASDAGVWVIEP